MHSPTRSEFTKACEEFEKREKRDAMYKVATFLVSHFWGKPEHMANSLGVLLLTWNQAFYRYGQFSFDLLEECIADNLSRIETFRERHIRSLENSDEDDIRLLFLAFLEALKISEGRSKAKKSPVGVAKTLHLLAPRFFPLWDANIARAYHCKYQVKPELQYLRFCRLIQEVANTVEGYIRNEGKTLIKLIDEYNYSKYTQGWI